jgi:hypothetical protein
MRYQAITSVTFTDLSKMLGVGEVLAVEPDHQRGIVRVMHHSVKGVPDGSHLTEQFYEYKEPDAIAAND